MNESEDIQIDLNEIKWPDFLQICLKIVWCLIIHTDTKIIDQEVTERAISKISDNHFSILNEIEKSDECLNIRKIRVWEQWQRW
jgi:hypothetical protein